MVRLFGWCFLLLTAPVLGAGGNDPKDPTNWTPIKINGKHKAPEFEDIDAWVNSPPLTVAQLKGKVVVVHFMAFG
jgi:hypothetical protein